MSKSRLLNLLDTKLNSKCSLFSERERERERDTAVQSSEGWSGGPMVLGKLSVPERPTNLNNSMATAYCACSRCGTFFLSSIFSLFFLPLWKTVRYRLK